MTTGAQSLPTDAAVGELLDGFRTAATAVISDNLDRMPGAVGLRPARVDDDQDIGLVEETRVDTPAGLTHAAPVGAQQLGGQQSYPPTPQNRPASALPAPVHDISAATRAIHILRFMASVLSDQLHGNGPVSR